MCAESQAAGRRPACRNCRQVIRRLAAYEGATPVWVHVFTGKRHCGGSAANVATPGPWVVD